MKSKLFRVIVGEHLPRPPIYMFLLGIVVVLNLIGMVMVLSASSISSLSTYGNAWYFFQRQLVWMFLGFGAFIIVGRMDYRVLKKISFPLLLVAATLLVLVLIPGLGINVDGGQRWLGAGAVRFQPSEVAKLAILVFAAGLIARRSDEMDDPHKVLWPLTIVTVALAGLIYLEHDMGTVVVVVLISGAVLFAGGIPWRQIAVMAVPGAVIGTLLMMAEPYRRTRVFTFLDPWSDTSNTGYQISQSLIAFGSGGSTGVGLGAGRSKWLFLPNAHTDFIYSIIGEELGLPGSLAVLGLFVAFAAAGMKIAKQAPDQFGALLAIGVTTWVVGQAIINLGAVTGLLPVSGIPLPFVSFGGTALIFTMAAAGVLASVARYSNDPRARTQQRDRKHHARSRR